MTGPERPAELEPAEPERDGRTDECVGDCEEDERCPTKTFCFNNARFVGTPKEGVYNSQLAVQEATMRTMSPGQLIANRANYVALGRGTLERMPSAVRARDRVVRDWTVNNAGSDWRTQGLEALHRLDMGPGGDPAGYFAMGDSSVNRSIGGSWRHKNDRLQQHARNLRANGCPLMKVRFDTSAGCVPDEIPSDGYP